MGALALLWGSGFLWVELALRGGLTPLQITAARAVLGAAVLLGLTLLARQRLPRDRATWGRLAIAALFCNALPFALFGFGQQTVDSGVAGVLNATTPLWALLINLRWERPGRMRVGGLVVGFAGILLIFEPWKAGGAGWGALAILGAAASYAVGFTVIGRTLAPSGTKNMSMAAAQMMTAAAMALVAAPAGGPLSTEVTAGGLAAVAILGVFATGVTFYLNYRIVVEEGATAAATVGYLLPVVSLTLGAVVLREPLSARIVAGMAVVLAGVAMTRVATAAIATTKRVEVLEEPCRTVPYRA